jgi:DNA-binding transcriptional LysR family regulator
MIELLTLEWRCFIETARRGNVSKAADHLHLPQPSVTKYIQKLETELGVPLFQRSNRGMKLTETGERFYNQVGAFGERFAEAMRSEMSLGAEVSGTVTLGAHRVIALGHLPQKIAQIYRVHPDLRIEVHFSSSPEVARLVASGKLDYGLVVNPIRLPGLVMVKVAEEGVALYSNSSDFDSLKKPRIFYNPEMQRLPMVLRKLPPSAVLEPVTDYEILGKLASVVGGSAALLPEPVASRYGLKHQLTSILYRAPLSLVFRASIERSPRHRAIIKGMVKKV